MKFCKKCHKMMIKTVYTQRDMGIRCRCDDTISFIAKSETIGVIDKALSKVKRCGLKTRVAKELNSE